MRLVSIMGDSISTYEGYNPEGFSVFYDTDMQNRNGLTSVYDTWWAKVNQALHAFLCVNNSYSGSRVTGKNFPSGSSDKRIRFLSSAKHRPDMILVYLGCNDFGYGVPVSRKAVYELYTSIGLEPNIMPDQDYFEDSYDLMIKKIRSAIG